MSRRSMVTYVLVVPKPKPKPAVIPQLPIERFSFLRRIIERVLLIHAIEKSPKAFLAQLVKPVIPVLVTILLFGSELALPHWHCKIWCALKDFHLARLRPDFLRDLDSGGTCADDSYTFPLDVDAYTYGQGRFKTKRSSDDIPSSGQNEE